jgi:hypothetical protein
LRQQQMAEYRTLSPAETAVINVDEENKLCYNDSIETGIILSEYVLKI